MNSAIRTILLATMSSLFFVVSAAHAENWVQIIAEDPDGLSVDVDSIRTGEDGLAYYTAEDDFGTISFAVDCRERIIYLVGDSADWRSKGIPVEPKSWKATKVDFVCSRVP